LVGAASSVVCAVIIAIVDLYLSGHGYTSLTREHVTWSEAGVHLSIGDLILLGTAALATGLTWWFYGRDA
jgi:hypothetical protein